MIIIYRDDNARAIFIENQNGVQFLNNLQAFQDSITDSFLSIRDISRDIEIMSDIEYDQFEDDGGALWGASGVTTTNNLNAIFASSGGTGDAPIINSSLAVTLTQGGTLNYELTASNGVGYEWDLSTVSDIVNVEGNVRKLIGGSSLVAGTYNIPVKAINYYGEDSQTLVLTVSSPPFSNTKSVFFRQNDYCNLTANTSNPFYRFNQGSATAWSVAFWFKPSSSNNQNQTILSFGGDDPNNEGRVQIKYNGNNSSRRRVGLVYGTNNNNLIMWSSNGSTSSGAWAHWIIVYDGGTTENGSGGITTSYSRFKIYKNGVMETKSNSNSNYGFSGEIRAEHFRFCRQSGGAQYMRNSNVDELALWSSDQNLNISDIYNLGNAHNLNLLPSPPSNYWRMGDGDIYPTLSDNSGTLDATMVNMTVADIVNDVP